MITKIGKELLPYYKSVDDARNALGAYDWFIDDPAAVHEDNQESMYYNMVNNYGLSKNEANALIAQPYIYENMVHGKPISGFVFPDKKPRFSSDQQNKPSKGSVLTAAIPFTIGAGIAGAGAGYPYGHGIAGALAGAGIGAGIGALALRRVSKDDHNDMNNTLDATEEALRSGYPKLLAAYKQTED